MAENGYSAGNLEFKIQTMGSNVSTTLTNINKRLKDMKSLLGEVGKTLSAMNTSEFKKTMQELTEAITPFVDKLQMAEKSLSSFENILKMSGRKRTINLPTINGEEADTTSSAKNNKKLDLSFTKMLNKLYFIRNYTKQLANSMANILQSGIDYTETLNLWQVAMRGNREEAEKFINTMNKAYGISTKTLMQYQAIFKNMLSSLGGISQNVSYQLSEYLTQMALDYASLYNTSIEKAMTTFQSVLSGQVRPIRSIAGYDITETTIYQLYQQLGGEKTMRQLTQTEKRLLRLYAVFQQMDKSGAVGDLAKTFENSANQLRLMSESLKELGTWLGLIAEQYIKPILKYLNAGIITITNIIKAIAKANNLQLFEGGTGVQNLEDINEEVDKLQGKLLDFDKFSVLGGGSSDAEESLGIDEKLLTGLMKYQSILSNVSSEATKLAEKWTALFVKFDNNGNIVGLTKNFYDLYDSIKGLTLGLSVFISLFKKSLLPVLITSYLTNENLRNSINKVILTLMPTLSRLMPILNDVLISLLDIATPILEILASIIQLLNELDLLQPILLSILSIIVAMKGYKLLNSLSNINGLIGVIATSIKTKLTNALGKVGVMFQFLKEEIMGFASGFILSFSILNNIFNSLEPSTRKVVSILSVLTGVLVTVLGLVLAIREGARFGLIGATIAGVGLGAIVAGIKGYASSVKAYKNGGVVEDGIFTMSKGELIGNFNDGTTVVANNQQILQGIENGVYRAVKSALQSQRSDVVINLDGKQIAKANINNTANALNNNYNIRLNPR